jgi:hypothetical protein
MVPLDGLKLYSSREQYILPASGGCVGGKHLKEETRNKNIARALQKSTMRYIVSTVPLSISTKLMTDLCPQNRHNSGSIYAMLWIIAVHSRAILLCASISFEVQLY